MGLQKTNKKVKVKDGSESRKRESAKRGIVAASSVSTLQKRRGESHVTVWQQSSAVTSSRTVAQRRSSKS